MALAKGAQVRADHLWQQQKHCHLCDGHLQEDTQGALQHKAPLVDAPPPPPPPGAHHGRTFAQPRELLQVPSSTLLLL